jgi:hypothetical protein
MYSLWFIPFLQEGFLWQVEACEGRSCFGFVEKIQMIGTTHAAFTLLRYYVIAYFAELPFDMPMVLTFLIIR